MPANAMTDHADTRTAERGERAPAPEREPVAERERHAERLLRSTAARSYDPELDIDWSAPLVEGKAFMHEHRCSLYGTPLWDRLSPAQRVELGKHETASITGTGIWFEMVLLRLLAKVTFDGDPTSRHWQYVLAEMADECRHSTMFARLISTLGTPAYRPARPVHELARLLATIGHGPTMWGAILLGEELPDRFQREMVDADNIQPVVRMVNRIHITEEARHIALARAELLRSVATMPRAALPYHRAMIAQTAFVVARNLINPQVYRSVGLDPRQAHRAALANPHHQRTIRWYGEKIVPFLRDAGLIGAPGMSWWRRAFLIGPGN